MRSLSLTTVFTLCLSILAATASQAATSKYRVIWRDNPASTAVIGWVQGTGSNPTVYYGTEDNGTNWSAYTYSRAVDRSVAQSGMTHMFSRLSGLSANTKYFYVIRDSEGTSIRMWFKTAPADGSVPFSFVAGGDSRNNRTPRQNANRMVGKLRPLFVMFGGDMTNTGTDTEWSDWWDDWQLTRSSDGRMYPIIAARGNHESSNAIVHNMFDTPSSDVYYAMDVGGSLMRIYTLNTEMAISGSQTTWLTGDLAANDARTWKITHYHKPMRPHEVKKSEGTNQYNYWSGPFFNHRMNLVVECDAHTVKHTWPVIPSTGIGSDEGFIRNDDAGTVYVGEGTWGAPLRANDDNKDWTRNSASFNAVHWVHVTADTMGLRTVKVDNVSNVGTVSDSNPFGIPSNLDIWSPSNGSVIKFLPIPGAPASSGFVSSRVSSGKDDAEENASTGAVQLGSSDLELVTDGTVNQKVGMRFTGITVPKGATITNAYIQFTVDETATTSTSLSIRGQAADNAGSFTTSTGNISGRSLTTASVSWNPASWGTVGAAGTDQRTPNLASIISEITSRSGWSSGNSLVLIVTGSGKRTAEAYEGSASQAPLLVVEYSETSSGSVSSRVASGKDDAEENASTGAVQLGSSDLELVTDGTVNQKVGMRFTGITVPKGATITNAYIQFTVDETATTSTSLSIRGQAADNAGSFTTSTGNISGRSLTTASVAWNPAGWGTVGAAGTDQRTPNLASIISEITSRSGWSSGNSIALVITGSGKRTAEAYEGSASQAPLLVINYSSGAAAKQGAGYAMGESPAQEPMGLERVMAISNRLSLSQGGSIRILNLPLNAAARVYDAGGRDIQALSHSPYQGMLEWNGRTVTGTAQVGVYYLRISAEAEKARTLPLWIQP